MGIARVATQLTAALAVAGLAVSIYLTWASYRHDILVCGVGDCNTVQSSEYAEVFGVSIAWLGIAMYAGLLVLLELRRRWTALNDLTSVAILFVAICGTVYSAWLTYLEIWVIEAICQWCVVSAILITTIMVIEITRFSTADLRMLE